MKRSGASAWLTRCQSNLTEFQRSMNTMSKDQQIQFVRNQYLLLTVVRKALSGKVRLQGFSHK